MTVGEVYERSITISLGGVLTFDALRRATAELELMLEDRRGWCVILDLSATLIHTVATQWVGMTELLRQVTDRWVIVGSHPDIVDLADGLMSLAWSGIWVDQAGSAHVARLLANAV